MSWGTCTANSRPPSGWSRRWKSHQSGTVGGRLFALRDLIDGGPHTTEALVWLEIGHIALSVRGNHEALPLEKIDSGEAHGRLPWTTLQWLVDQVPRADWSRWAEVIWRMPLAVMIRARAGPVGLVHAVSLTARHSESMCAMIDDGDADTVWLVMNSAARAHGALSTSGSQCTAESTA